MTYDLQNFNYRLTTYVLDATTSLARDVMECSDSTLRVAFSELFTASGESERPAAPDMTGGAMRTVVVAEIHHRMRNLENQHAIKDWKQRGTDSDVFEFQEQLRNLIDAQRESLGLSAMKWPGDE
jgi:hypothetical protein